MTELRVGSATDVGLVRAKNEDELLVAAPLFAVADGMGGAAAGEVASATAIRGLYEAFVAAGKPTPDHLVQAAHAANRAVWEQAEANPEMRGMGTTLVALALVNNEQLAAINVGDSRLYLLRAGELRQITSDHNLVAELVAEGRLSKEEAEFHPRRNIMTRALGVDPDVPVDDFLIEGSPGDRFLLCSDGLPRELSDEEIASLLQRVADPDEAAHQLVEEAKRQGGNDNITVVVVDIVADEGKDPTLTTAVPLQRASEEAAQEEEDQAEARSMSRRERRQQKRRTKSRLLTPRVIVFVGLLIALLAAAVGGVAWYARDGYFVGLKGNQIVIYRGRPGRRAVVPPHGGGHHLSDHRPGRVVPPCRPHGRSGGALVGGRSSVRQQHGRREESGPSSHPPEHSQNSAVDAAFAARTGKDHHHGYRMNVASLVTRAPARRRTELGLIILAVLLTGGLYALAGLGKAGNLPANIGPFLAIIFALLLVAHLAMRRWAANADPILLPRRGAAQRDRLRVHRPAIHPGGPAPGGVDSAGNRCLRGHPRRRSPRP